MCERVGEISSEEGGSVEVEQRAPAVEAQQDQSRASGDKRAVDHAYLADQLILIGADIAEHVRDAAQNDALDAPLDDVLVAADTIVWDDNGDVLGKPADAADAAHMLKLLSGKTHHVITGCAICRDDEIISFSQITEVEFYPLTDEEISAYIDTGEPNDKAGAYGIQGKGALLVKQIKGDYYNVVGLPVALLNKKLKEFEDRS